jgi:hypothetical protein
MTHVIYTCSTNKHNLIRTRICQVEMEAGLDAH